MIRKKIAKMLFFLLHLAGRCGSQRPVFYQVPDPVIFLPLLALDSGSSTFPEVCQD
jgi:hypothetical protein